ncbi:type 1 glutamine amidotransferase domain-containing protein [Gordonia metallireducens]|uniref:type 1 glutamine amidotransferase domain-containing protein n=1 Tax=Gordonia metallireducens TaxID=2897779 RepID=UPI001E5356DE|nr:type 1 glutamine amidotransferase domain-containing protein [Gordonia metallireducens]
MSLANKKVLVLTANYFEESELIYAVYRLREEGAEVTVASPDGAALTGKNHMSPFPADTSYDALGAGSFDAVVIPGGFAPDLVRRYPKALELVREINAANKPVATVCHGGWVAISAGIVKGRKATAVSAIKDDMVNAGVEFVDEPVVTDGNLITSRVPADMGLWMKAVIEAIRTA